MTKTEQFQAAWETLQSEDALLKMIVECDCMPDELRAASARLDRVIRNVEQRMKGQRLESILSQMRLAGVTPQELELFINSQPKKKKKKPGKIHVATIDGVEVHKGLPLPKIMIAKGWNRINQIPEQYLTEEYKASLKK